MILSYQSNKDQKIFVWAPSNAAVDEIVWRLVNNGLIGSNGTKKKAELVRVGVLDYNPPEIVRKHSLDYLVDERMKKSTGKEDNREADEYQRRNNKIELIKEHLLNAERTGISYDEFLTRHKREMDKLYKMMSTEMKKEFVSTKLNLRRFDILKQLQNNHQKAVNDLKNKNLAPNAKRINFENEILSESKIIWTTLSMSGIDKIEKMDFYFSHLIVDEAWQSTEISTLIPFIHSPERIILVGDQNQLPATCFSWNAIETNYCKSFYERLWNQKIPQIMLTVQYRMHPEIREFPSDQFYNGR